MLSLDLHIRPTIFSIFRKYFKFYHLTLYNSNYLLLKYKKVKLLFSRPYQLSQLNVDPFRPSIHPNILCVQRDYQTSNNDPIENSLFLYLSLHAAAFNLDNSAGSRARSRYERPATIENENPSSCRIARVQRSDPILLSISFSLTRRNGLANVLPYSAHVRARLISPNDRSRCGRRVPSAPSSFYGLRWLFLGTRGLRKIE